MTLEKIKLFGSAKSKKNKNKNDENVLHLEITEVVLVHCNIVNNHSQRNSRVLYTFALNMLFDQLLYISTKKTYFPKLLIWTFLKLNYGY